MVRCALQTRPGESAGHAGETELATLSDDRGGLTACSVQGCPQDASQRCPCCASTMGRDGDHGRAIVDSASRWAAWAAE
eukprot:6459904-Amphidinium_carterae.3